MILLKRTTTGKKNKSLIKKGLVPAVIYDKEVNILVQVPLADFQKNYHQSGHTGVIKTEFEGEKYNLMIDHIQINPVTRNPIHATLRNVNLKEELNAMVPIEYVNGEECKGVKEEGGVLIENIYEVEVTALPTDIPSHLNVDVIDLKIGDSIKLEDIKLPEGVRFATEDENILSQIAVTVTEKFEEVIETGPTETVEVAGTKEKPEGEGEAAASAESSEE